MNYLFTPPIAFLPGNWEWVVLGVLALIFFGNRLPSVARSLGQAWGELKKGLREGAEGTDSTDSASATSGESKKCDDNSADQNEKAE